MSTTAWTKVCSASAVDFLWLVSMRDQPFRGRPNQGRRHRGGRGGGRHLMPINLKKIKINK